MVEYSTLPELPQNISEAALGLYVLAMCFTAKQRQAIRRRDNQECQMDCGQAKTCGGKFDPLEVHHVLPQAYSRQFDIDPDIPENGVTLCRSFHQQDIHATPALEAQQALKERRVYWNTAFDRKLHAIALRNTQRARKKGWIFPKK